MFHYLAILTATYVVAHRWLFQTNPQLQTSQSEEFPELERHTRLPDDKFSATQFNSDVPRSELLEQGVIVVDPKMDNSRGYQEEHPYFQLLRWRHVEEQKVVEEEDGI